MDNNSNRANPVVKKHACFAERKGYMELNKPERVAHIIGKICASGVENVAFNYYRAIDHSKYQFDFFYDADSTLDPPQDLIKMGARFYRIPPYQRLPDYIKALRTLFREGKYRIVHSHMNTLSVFPLYAAWKEHVPIRIAHNHSVPGGNEFKRNALKRFLRLFSRVFANAFCACSEEAGRWLFGNRLYNTGRVTVLKNAISFSQFRVDRADIEEQRKAIGIPEGCIVIGNVGRFTHAKNHAKIISVFEAVRKKHKNTVLLLVGDGEKRQEIEQRVCEDGIETLVYLVGKVTNPEKYYNMMDVILLPSIFEGVPVTIIEGQITGVPCVISDVVSTDAVISNGCHYLSIKDNDEKWADTVLSCVGEQVVLNDNSKKYDITYAVKELENKYNSLLEG